MSSANPSRRRACQMTCHTIHRHQHQLINQTSNPPTSPERRACGTTNINIIMCCRRSFFTSRPCQSLSESKCVIAPSDAETSSRVYCTLLLQRPSCAIHVSFSWCSRLHLLRRRIVATEWRSQAKPTAVESSPFHKPEQ